MGLLEDAILAGNTGQMAQVSSFFQPGVHEQLSAAGQGAYERGELPYMPVDPETKHPWGHYGTLSRNAETDALLRRDTDRMRLMEVIGRIDDPELQARLLSNFGAMPTPTRPPLNIEGMSPTQALAAQQAYDRAEGGDPFEGYMGGKLKGELMKMRLAHELNAPEREASNTLRLLQAQTAMGAQQTNEAYKRSLMGNQEAGNQIKMLGLIDNIAKVYQAAAQSPALGGNPEVASQMGEILKSLIARIQGTGGISGTPAGKAAMASDIGLPGIPSTSTDPNDYNRTPTLSELTGPEAGTPMGSWWDQSLPVGTALAPDVNRLASLNRELEHLRRFAPGDLGAQMRIQRLIQEAIARPTLPTPPVAATTMPKGGKPKGVTVTRE